jgi:hypothetical protein
MLLVVPVLYETLAKHILQTDFDLSTFPSTCGKPKYFQTADLKEAGGSINLGLPCSSTACIFISNIVDLDYKSHMSMSVFNVNQNYCLKPQLSL